MSRPKESVVSAQVVLKPASGKPLAGAAISAANLKEYLPSKQAVSTARQAFAAAGFEVAAAVGNSFSITAPAAKFEQFFGRTELPPKSAAKGDYELPREAIPAEVRPHIEAVTFTPPPEFGPGGQFG